MEKRKFWAVVPAAGFGKRMNSETPKQYISLGEVSVIERTLISLLDHYAIEGAVIAISHGDEYWNELGFYHHKPFEVVEGGAERSDSVLSALIHLDKMGCGDDWALVHDAARPNIAADDVMKLVLDGANYPDGALLGYKAKDTLKKVNSEFVVQQTIPREDIWHAMTPQMFPVNILKDAILNAKENGISITDDSSAMELAGYKPKFIEGRSSNIKITTQVDFEIVKQLLQ